MKAGITPGPNPIATDKIIHALNNSIGYAPTLNCFNLPILVEVGVCFDESLAVCARGRGRGARKRWSGSV